MDKLGIKEIMWYDPVMTKATQEKVSKTMAFALRHKPAELGLTLSAEGWISVAVLAKAISTKLGSSITAESIKVIVAEDSKGRYSLRMHGHEEQVRAVQGHSFPVALGLVPSVPPAVLFHGTVARNLNAIMGEGLKPGSRQFVHLSSNRETAISVGSRHGQPIILTVNTVAAGQQGVVFFQAENGVWLVSHMPAEFLTVS